MKSTSRRRFLAGAFALAILSACQSAPPLPESGRYEGNLIVRQGTQLVSDPVDARVFPLENGHATIQLSELNGVPRPLIELSNVGPDSLVLSIPEFTPASILLSRSENCYVSASPQSLSLCTARHEVVIESRGLTGEALFSLTLDYFPEESPVQLEPPRSYAMDDAMADALTLDFRTRAEFERVMQARHQAANAYLNLFPHFGVNSTLAGVLGAMGDLAPFLLPSRWLETRSKQFASEAEEDALIIMRGDTGVQLEGMAYAYARDRKLQDAYRDAIAEADKIRGQIAAEGPCVCYPPGTLDILSTLLDELQAEAEQLDLDVREQRMYLAQAMGKVNPGAVTDLLVPDEATPIGIAAKLDSDELSNEALGRSFELRQMDYLIQAASSARDAAYFGWLDPSGDPSAGLGPGLGEAIAVEGSRVDELRVMRQQVESSVLQKVAVTVAEYNDSLDAHAHWSSDLTLQEARLQRLHASLDSHQRVEIPDLVSALRDHLKAVISLGDSESVYRISRAKLDRLLLRGYYLRLSSLPDPAGP